MAQEEAALARKYVVVGLGEFGRAVAMALSRNGYEVVAVDRDMREVERVKEAVTLAVCLDAAQEAALASQGIGEADVLIAGISEDFEAQLLVVVFAKKMGIKTVIARATTPDHARILQAVGADEVLNPQEEAARSLVQRLMIPNISSYHQLEEGFSIVELPAPPGMHGQTLMALKLRQRFRTNVVGISRVVKRKADGTPVRRFNPAPAPDEEIVPGDSLTLIGSDLDLANLMEAYR